MVEEHISNVDAEPEDIRSIVEKLKAWSESLSPSEQVMLGLLLKRLSEDEAVERTAEPLTDLPSVD